MTRLKVTTSFNSADKLEQLLAELPNSERIDNTTILVEADDSQMAEVKYKIRKTLKGDYWIVSNPVKQIITTAGEVRRLIREFGCSQVYVYYSLTYQRNSKLAQDIRRSALRGGAKIYTGVADEPLIHDIYTEQDVYVETVGNVRLELDIITGNAVVYQDDKITKQVNDISVAELHTLQKEIKALAYSL